MSNCQVAALLVVGVIWATCVATGMAALWAYQYRAGEPGAPPSKWPPHSNLVLSADKHTLLVFAHPRCPCTRATLAELNKILAHGEHEIDTQVVFLAPPQFDEQWFDTSLTRSAREMGVQVHRDVSGLESKQFRVRTSGHALLYDAQGGLRFSGGITGSRGHEGDNYGASELLSALHALPNESKGFPVFGCSLVGASQ